MQILIIKSRNIGDVLLAGVVASALKRRWPESTIRLLVKRGTEGVVARHPHIDQVLTFPVRETGESGPAFLWRQWRWVRRLAAAGIDLAINTTEGDRGAITAYLARAQRRIGLLKPRRGPWPGLLYSETRRPVPGRHMVLQNLSLLPEGVADYRRVHLGFSDAALARVRELLGARGADANRALVQVHATSRWFFKCWDDRAMARVIDHLATAHQAQVVLTAGPDRRERDKLDAILDHCETSPLDLGGQLTLEQTAALASLCRLYFGVDTAPMHMAAALDVPVVALFGPTGAFDWGPWPNGWDGVETPYPARGGVQRAGPHCIIQKAWDCVPCGRDGCEGSKRSRCLEELSANEVIPEVDRVMRRLSGIGA